jgi:hypothetical protein
MKPFALSGAILLAAMGGSISLAEPPRAGFGAGGQKTADDRAVNARCKKIE